MAGLPLLSHLSTDGATNELSEKSIAGWDGDGVFVSHCGFRVDEFLYYYDGKKALGPQDNIWLADSGLSW